MTSDWTETWRSETGETYDEWRARQLWSQPREFPEHVKNLIARLITPPPVARR